jgi:hypothetical protein
VLFFVSNIFLLQIFKNLVNNELERAAYEQASTVILEDGSVLDEDAGEYEEMVFPKIEEDHGFMAMSKSTELNDKHSSLNFDSVLLKSSKSAQAVLSPLLNSNESACSTAEVKSVTFSLKSHEDQLYLNVLVIPLSSKNVTSNDL